MLYGNTQVMSADIPFKCHSYVVSAGWVHCGDYGVTMGKEPKASSSVGICDRKRLDGWPPSVQERSREGAAVERMGEPGLERAVSL